MLIGHKRVCNSRSGGACDCGGVAWRLVPLEPTKEMIVEGVHRIPQSERHTSPAAEAERVWRSMVIAAPDLGGMVYTAGKDECVTRDGVAVPVKEIVRLLNEHQRLVEHLFDPILARGRIG